MHRLTRAALLVCAWASHAAAAGLPEDPAEITQEITLRCMYEMGEFGDMGLQACVQADQEAVEALKRYPPEARATIDRCYQAMWSRGYALVRHCVDRELRATD